MVKRLINMAENAKEATIEFISTYGKYMYTVYVTLPTGIVKTLYKSDWYNNLITNAGRVWMLNRWANDDRTFAKSIAIGTGVTSPQLGQTALVTETARENTANTAIGSPTWQMKMNAVFTATQVNNTTEIGVFDATVSGSMLARDTHAALSVPPGSSISFDYVFGLYTSKTAIGWALTAGKTKTYEIADYVNVLAVLETDTANGYLKKTSTATVEATAGTYWHDGGSNKTYIHCTDDANPSTHTIVILSAAT